MPTTLSHGNQIVAVFEDDAAAAAARNALLEAGVPESAIRLVGAPVASPPPESAGDQILSAFMGLFSSAEEHRQYSQTAGRGHAMLVVTPAHDSDRRHLVELLERTHPIDFDAKLEAWRQTDYEGKDAATTDATTGRPVS